MPVLPRLRVTRLPELPGLTVVEGTGVAADIMPHAHGAVVAGLCLEGGRRLSCGGGVWTLEAGEGFVIPNGVRHACAPLVATGQAYVVVAVDPQLLGQLGRTPGAAEDWARPWRGAEAGRELLRLARALEGGGGEALEALAGLAHCLRLRPGPQRPHHPAVAVARAAIEADAAADHGLAALAGLAGVGATYLERLFVRETGMSVGQYVLSRRVRHAAGRIAAGDPLPEVALAAGFCDQSHLTRQFRQRMGVTPGAYREGGR